jgi:DNA polymerase III subunit epsilon
LGLLIVAAAIVSLIAFVAYLNRDSTPPDAGHSLDLAEPTHSYSEGAKPAAARRTSVSFSMLPKQFIVLDLETTGLDPVRNEIIEVGAIRVNLDSDTHATFQALVKPTRHIPKRISAMTGISQVMLDAEGREPRAVLIEFIDFIQDLPLVTFNAQFDMGFLQNAARLHGFAITNRYTCALKLARRAWPGLPSYRLVDLAAMGQLSDSDTHRALGDCKRTVIIFTSAASHIGKKIRWSHPPKELLVQ